MSLHRPVFFDPSSQRWRRVLRITLVVSILAAVLLGSLAVAIFTIPGLPSLSLNAAHEPARRAAGSRATAVTRAARFKGARRKLEENLKKSLPPLNIGPPGKFERIAFYVNWDDNSWVSLKRNLGEIDTLTAEWLHLVDGVGRVSLDEPHKQDMVLRYVRERRPGMSVVALINNFRDGKWDSASLASMLADAEARRRVIDFIDGFLTQRQLAGVNIDFEAVPVASQPKLVEFMTELQARLKPKGLQVSQSVPLDDASFDFKALAQHNDYLMLMAYDEHAADNDAGPIASQDWFVTNVGKRLRELPADKVVVGIGSYGYDWKNSHAGGEELSFQDALTFGQDSDDDIELDETSGNPGFVYHDEHAVMHRVWFLDAVTVFNQVKAAARLMPRGFALWRLGSEDPGVWQVLANPAALDDGVAKQLETLHFGYDLDYEGKGEILRVAGTPQDGRRTVSYDPDIGLLTDDEIDQFPRGFVINRWGYDASHVIALTFDDGPDPEWTPKILDVLRERHVPATFFIIGRNAEANPELINRMADEGHEIGNHTFTHPNIADVSDRRVELELNATERFIESRLGKRSLLFRPPYAQDVEPETPDQVHPLVLTSGLGYYSVGMQIDPDDWRRPGVE